MNTEQIAAETINHYALSNNAWNDLQAAAKAYYQERSPENRAEFMALLVPLLDVTARAAVNKGVYYKTVGFSTRTALAEAVNNGMISSPTKLIGSEPGQYNPEMAHKESGALIRTFLQKKADWSLSNVIRRIVGRDNDKGEGNSSAESTKERDNKEGKPKANTGVTRSVSIDVAMEQHANELIDQNETADFVSQLIQEDLEAKLQKALSELKVEDRVLLERYYRGEELQEDLAAEYSVSVRTLKRRIEKLENILRSKLQA